MDAILLSSATGMDPRTAAKNGNSALANGAARTTATVFLAAVRLRFREQV